MGDRKTETEEGDTENGERRRKWEVRSWKWGVGRQEVREELGNVRRMKAGRLEYGVVVNN